MESGEVDQMKAVMPRRTALLAERDPQPVLTAGDSWVPAPRRRIPVNTVSFGALLREVLADEAAHTTECSPECPAATRGEGGER